MGEKLQESKKRGGLPHWLQGAAQGGSSFMVMWSPSTGASEQLRDWLAQKWPRDIELQEGGRDEYLLILRGKGRKVGTFGGKNWQGVLENEAEDKRRPLNSRKQGSFLEERWYDCSALTTWNV